jgi:hypothetical protein
MELSQLIPIKLLIAMGFSLGLIAPAIATTFQIGEAVEVNWNNRWWPATLERLQNDRYCITYDGSGHSLHSGRCINGYGVTVASSRSPDSRSHAWILSKLATAGNG